MMPVSVSVKRCVVSFQDGAGFRHSVEVEAETLDEAAALAVKNFSDHDCTPPPMIELAIDVTAPPVRHSVRLKTVKDWTTTGGRGPKEILLKDRVKKLLEGLLKP
jgi:hypothetical protein